MYKETNIRSIVKGISWRIFGTCTTIIIVYLFFGRLELAIAAGFVESISKIGLYWLHERLWVKIHLGKKKIKPFNVWFTGLPLSGKTTLANAVHNELKKLKIPLERIDSKDIREIVPDIGYSREDRNRHIRRIGHFIKVLQQNSISTVASFISPYNESRKAVREMVHNNVIVYVKASLETCKKRDAKGLYEQAAQGKLKNFTGVSDIYEEPQHAEIVIDTENTSIQKATKEIVRYVKKKYIK